VGRGREREDDVGGVLVRARLAPVHAGPSEEDGTQGGGSVFPRGELGGRGSDGRDQASSSVVQSHWVSRMASPENSKDGADVVGSGQLAQPKKGMEGIHSHP
jgi:hypothetical protein